MISTLIPSKNQTKNWRKNQEWYDMSEVGLWFNKHFIQLMLNKTVCEFE